MRTLLWVGVTLFMLSSCGLKTSDKIDSEAVNQEIEARKIKRVKEGEIIEAAYSQGKRIAESLIDSLATNAKDASLCGTSLLTHISQEDIPLLHSIEVACELPTSATEKEKMVWEAYQSTMENQTLEDNIQKLTGDSLLYSYPYAYTDTTGMQQLAVVRMLISKREVIRGL